MKQVLQNLSNGKTSVVEAPVPQLDDGHLLIDTSVSLVSSGTERMLVDFGKANIIEKARQQPEKVKMVLDKVQTDGLLSTIDAVKSKLSQPLALGYCNVGIVNAVGNGVEGFSVGDRVVSNGPHADVVRVPKNLCAKIPDNVPDEQAVFTVMASIGLQGIRLASPSLGESFVVTGVGLIGLLTVQLLRANGCRVLAIDYDNSKLELAKKLGAEICNPSKGGDPVSAGLSFSRNKGVDGVIITAATKSNEPVAQAAQMCRKRGRIILVGVTGLSLDRSDFYEKEIKFQVSCSYGPGRYDSDYEEKGADYPLGFVRWTEQRNFEAALDLMADGQLKVNSLISHRFDFDRAPDAYELLISGKPALGVLLQYHSVPESRHNKRVQFDSDVNYDPLKAIVGFVGAGNYASRILIPAFKKGGAQLHTIASSKGTSGVINGRRMGFSETTTDTESVFNETAINTLVIATRHNSHASFVCNALKNKKNVFVEKPLAINLEELKEIESVYQRVSNLPNAPRLMVGFNRRFSPQILKIMELLDSVNEPKSFIITINAGMIPSNHWTQDVKVGGGRIIGEACHFIDLMRNLANCKIVSYQSRCMGRSGGVRIRDDKAVITLGFEDGSFGTIHYLANGPSEFPKERVEVFTSGRVLQLDNFCKLKGYGWPGFKKMNLLRQDKGQNKCAEMFIDSIEKGGTSPIASQELFEVAEVTIKIAEQLRIQL
ncbi:MAG: zinc-binding dehydrogenase [Desulfobacter sp.]|nr:MAG: zinc-binding dehydrogenase [Desulfobacter sp.]